MGIQTNATLQETHVHLLQQGTTQVYVLVMSSDAYSTNPEGPARRHATHPELHYGKGAIRDIKCENVLDGISGERCNDAEGSKDSGWSALDERCVAGEPGQQRLPASLTIRVGPQTTCPQNSQTPWELHLSRLTVLQVFDRLEM